MKIVNGIVDTAIQKIIPIANNKARPRYPMTAEFITIHNTANARGNMQNKMPIMLLIKMNINHGILQ